MKKIMFFLLAVICIIANGSINAQKYKTASDTFKLNKEYVEVSNDIAELTSKLTIAQNDIPAYKTKAGNKASNAQSSAKESSEQASKATNGDLGDAKNARKKANKAADDANDAKDASDDVKDQDKKIDKLTTQLKKKQDKLQELDNMRTAIRILPQ